MENLTTTQIRKIKSKNRLEKLARMRKKASREKEKNIFMMGVFEKKNSINLIIEEVCDYVNENKHICETGHSRFLYKKITPELMKLKTRKREVALSRQIAMYFSKKLTKNSYAVIGEKIGDKKHTTVIHSCNTINNLVDTDKTFASHMEKIGKNIKERMA